MLVKRIDESLPVPCYKTPGAVGLDLYCREDVYVYPGTYETIPLNTIAKPPDKHFLMLVPRSSLFKNKGLIVPNSIGIIDPDYCGDDDEITGLVYNPTSTTARVFKGERLFQLLVMPVTVVSIRPVSDFSLREGNRSGHGSTGLT